MLKKPSIQPLSSEIKTNFFKVPNHFLYLMNYLSPTAIKVFLYLLSYQNAEEIRPGYDFIASACKCSRSAVKRAMKELVKECLVKYVCGKDGKTTNRYTIRVDSIDQSCARTKEENEKHALEFKVDIAEIKVDGAKRRLKKYEVAKRTTETQESVAK